MKKYRVLITDGLDPVGIDLLKTHPEVHFDVHAGLSAQEIQKLIPAYHALITAGSPVDASAIDAGKDLGLIVHAGTALSSINVDSARSRNILVRNTGVVNALSVAEHTLALLFSLTRQVASNSTLLKNGQWERGPRFRGVELHGKVLGVFGLGNVGKIVAEKAMALGMQVIAYDPFYPSVSLLPNKFKMLEMRFTLTRQPYEVFLHADFLTLHVSDQAETRPLIDEKEIEKLKDGAYLLNLSHGGAVDEKALLQALDSGKISGAALDVFGIEPPQKSNPLLTHERVVCTAHLGGETREAYERIAAASAEQVLQFFNSGMKRVVQN